MAVVWFPSEGGRHFCGRGGGSVLRLGAGDQRRSGSTLGAGGTRQGVIAGVPSQFGPGVRIVPEPIMCVVESVFKGGPSLHHG